MGIKSKIAIALAAATALLLGVFQNCSRAEFTSHGEDKLSGLGDTPVTICDPFSSTGGACTTPPPGGGPTPGLKANVYYLKNGRKVDDYIDKGTLLPILVQLSAIDIQARSWQVGFPGPGGAPLQDPTGDTLFEYFALDLTGFFELPASVAEGEYQFALFSDDGSILYLDGTEVVNNDGDHPMKWECARAAVSLKHGVKHDLRLKYYQGPRYDIGLQLYMRPKADMGKPCDASGGWQIIPSAGLSY